MSDAFTPQVRALLDRLEPPALSADFADSVVAQAEAMASLPPLPPLRKPRVRRRFALVVAAAGLVGVAAAAAVVPADAWRTIPVIGGIVELIDPARNDPAPAPARSEPAPAVSDISEPTLPDAAPEAEIDLRAAPGAAEGPSPVEDRAVVSSPVAISEPSAARPEPVERARDALPAPVREVPVAERPTPAPTRAATAAVVERPAEPAPERIRPADTSETRQQVRERTTSERQTARERMERRERRISRLN